MLQRWIVMIVMCVVVSAPMPLPAKGTTTMYYQGAQASAPLSSSKQGKGPLVTLAPYRVTISSPTPHPSTLNPTYTTVTGSPTASPTSTPFTNGVQYTGGMVLTSPIVFLVWYGAWTGPDDSTVQLVELFLQSLSHTAYQNVLTLYYMQNATGSQTFVGNTISFGGSVFVGYPYNTNITRANMNSVVESVIDSGQLPYNAQGVYLFLTSGDVVFPPFCSGACGFHSGYATMHGNIALASVGFATNCPNGCAPARIFANSVHGQLVDGFINVISHEMFVMVTGPWNSGWIGVDAKCQWTFGTLLQNDADNKTYNIQLGNEKFLVQREWVNFGGGYCALQYP